MVIPAGWSDADKVMWEYDSRGNRNHIGCGKLDLPEDSEFELASGEKPDCIKWWYSSSEITGEPTNQHSTEHMDPEKDCSNEQTGSLYQKYPWSAPGTAPVFSPCGAMGGHPYGCSGVLMDEFRIAKEFGDLCPCAGENRGHEYMGCGGFAYGGLAHEYDWPNAPITKWQTGSVQPVAWWTNIHHGGGYSYRLCKTPANGIAYLTEECFQNGHLDFVGDKQWVYYGEECMESETKIEMNATRINEGTFPLGSSWTAVPWLYQNPSNPENYGHVIDQIKVPESLEPGNYVLSWRYDCKCTDQVFNTCANIEITN